MKYLLMLLLASQLFGAATHICYHDSVGVHGFLYQNGMGTVPVSSVSLPDSWYTLCTRCAGWRINEVWLSPKVYVNDLAIKALPQVLTYFHIQSMLNGMPYFEVHMRYNNMKGMPEGWGDCADRRGLAVLDLRGNSITADSVDLSQASLAAQAANHFKVDLCSNQVCPPYEPNLENWMDTMCTKVMWNITWQETQTGCGVAVEKRSNVNVVFSVGDVITYHVENNGPVKISIVNVLGKSNVILNKYQQQGVYECAWQKPSNAGVYFIRYAVGNEQRVVKYINVK